MPTGLHIIGAAALAFRQDDGGSFGRAQTGGLDFFFMLVQTLFALALVCGLAYVIFRVVLPRLNVTRSAGSMVRVVDRIGLDARKSLYVIEVAGRWFVVAASEAGVQLVGELDAESAARAEQEAADARPTFGAPARAVRSAFAERLAQMMNKKGDRR